MWSYLEGFPGSPMPRPRSALAAALWLAAVGALAPASAQPTAPLDPPRTGAVLGVDSIYLANRNQDEIWTYRYLQGEDPDDVWVEVRDPFGGRILISDLFIVRLGTKTEGFLSGTMSKAVIVTENNRILAAIAFLAVGVLTVVLVPFAWLRRRFRRERTQRQALQETARQLAASREDERLRIARDLHDGPLQDLHALHMRLDAAAGRLAAVSAGSEEARRLRGAQDEAHTIIGELRGIAETLRPPALGPFGLAAALRTHAERFRRQYPGITVDLELDDDGQSLPESTRLSLFRIAQEAMANAVKHGGPSQVSVSLLLDTDQAVLTVEDDGSGLARPSDDPALPASGHFGLLGMRERVDALDGRLDVGNVTTGGVRVRATAPRPVSAEATAVG